MAATRAPLAATLLALHARVPPLGHGRVHRTETSGSTGQPATFLASDIEQVHWRAFTLRDHLWHARDFSGKRAAIRYSRETGSAPGWGPATHGVVATGPRTVLDIDTPVAAQVAAARAARVPVEPCIQHRGADPCIQARRAGVAGPARGAKRFRDRAAGAADVLQYQYVQKNLRQIQVRLVVGPRYRRDMEPRLTEIIHRRLGHPFDLDFSYEDSIARGASGKFEDFLCLA